MRVVGMVGVMRMMGMMASSPGMGVAVWQRQQRRRYWRGCSSYRSGLSEVGASVGNLGLGSGGEQCGERNADRDEYRLLFHRREPTARHRAVSIG
jgi:hypothetical protein